MVKIPDAMTLFAVALLIANFCFVMTIMEIKGNTESSIDNVMVKYGPGSITCHLCYGIPTQHCLKAWGINFNQTDNWNAINETLRMSECFKIASLEVNGIGGLNDNESIGTS